MTVVGWEQRAGRELVEIMGAAAHGSAQWQQCSAEIYRRHWPDILGWVGCELRDIDAAWDVTVESFSDAFAKLSRGEGPDDPDKLGAWLMGFAKLRSRKYIERVKSRLPTPVGGNDETLLSWLDADSPDARLRAAADDPQRLARVRALVPRVLATFKPQDQQICELRYGDEALTGREIAERLGLGQRTLENRLKLLDTMVADGFSALLLVEEGRAHCPQLAAILDQHARLSADFTTDLRKRVIQHYDTCRTCEACPNCRQMRSNLLREWTPALIPVLFLAGLNRRITEMLRLAASTAPAKPGTNHQPPPPPSAPASTKLSKRPRKRKRAMAGGGVALLIVLSLILILTMRQPHGPSHASTIKALPAAAVLPPIVYQSGDALVFRQGTTPPRTLATVPAGSAVFGLAWSWDGKYLAWFTQTGPSTNEQLQVTDVAAATTKTWACGGCQVAAFQGAQVMTTDPQQAGTLSAHPVGGGTPTPVPVNGLKTDGTLTGPPMIELLGSTPHDGAVVFFATGSLLFGIDDYLYTAGLSGQASILGAAQVSAAPGGDRVGAAADQIATSPDHTLLAYAGNRLGGDLCEGNESVTVVNLNSGTFSTVALPGTSANPARVQSVWVSADHTVYASAWAQPGDCSAQAAMAPGPGPVSARVYKLVDGRWVPTGATSPTGSGGPNGWTATAAGDVSIPSGTLVATVVYGTLTVSSATTSLSLGTTGAFAFAPTPR